MEIFDKLSAFFGIEFRNSDEENFGVLLKKIRFSEEMTSSELAEAAGVSQSYVSQLENNVRLPSDKIIKRLAYGLLFKKKVEDTPSDDLYSLSKNDKRAYNTLVSQLIEVRDYMHIKDIPSIVDNFKVLSLDEMMKDIETEEEKPLDSNEFILIYKNDENEITTVRNQAKTFEALFDVTNIGREQQAISYENGMTIYKKTSTYYKGRKLTKNEIDQVKRLLEAILDQEKEQ